MERDLLTLDFPESIETERLTIRGFRFGVGRAFNAAIIETLAPLQITNPSRLNIGPLKG